MRRLVSHLPGADSAEFGVELIRFAVEFFAGHPPVFAGEGGIHWFAVHYLDSTVHQLSACRDRLLTDEAAI
jgi:hypothetical protein